MVCPRCGGNHGGGGGGGGSGRVIRVVQPNGSMSYYQFSGGSSSGGGYGSGSVGGVQRGIQTRQVTQTSSSSGGGLGSWLASWFSSTPTQANNSGQQSQSRQAPSSHSGLAQQSSISPSRSVNNTSSSTTQRYVAPVGGATGSTVAPTNPVGQQTYNAGVQSAPMQSQQPVAPMQSQAPVMPPYQPYQRPSQSAYTERSRPVQPSISSRNVTQSSSRQAPSTPQQSTAQQRPVSTGSQNKSSTSTYKPASTPGGSYSSTPSKPYSSSTNAVRAARPTGDTYSSTPYKPYSSSTNAVKLARPVGETNHSASYKPNSSGSTRVSSKGRTGQQAKAGSANNQSITHRPTRTHGTQSALEGQGTRQPRVMPAYSSSQNAPGTYKSISSSAIPSTSTTRSTEKPSHKPVNSLTIAEIMASIDLNDTKDEINNQPDKKNIKGATSKKDWSTDQLQLFPKENDGQMTKEKPSSLGKSRIKNQRTTKATPSVSNQRGLFSGAKESVKSSYKEAERNSDSRDTLEAARYTLKKLDEYKVQHGTPNPSIYKSRKAVTNPTQTPFKSLRYRKISVLLQRNDPRSRISILTINLNKSSRTKATKSELLEEAIPVIESEEFALVFAQEISAPKTETWKTGLTNFKFYSDDNESGIMWSRDKVHCIRKFGKEERLMIAKRCLGITYDEMTDRACVVLLQTASSKLLAISWHGPQNALTMQKRYMIFQQLQKFALEITRSIGESDTPIIIGGDFNFHLPSLEPEYIVPGFTVEDEYEPTERRKGKNKIDSFVHTSGDLVWDNIEAIGSDLEKLDHDPVRGNVYLNSRMTLRTIFNTSAKHEE